MTPRTREAEVNFEWRQIAPVSEHEALFEVRVSIGNEQPSIKHVIGAVIPRLLTNNMNSLDAFFRDNLLY